MLTCAVVRRWRLRASIHAWFQALFVLCSAAGCSSHVVDAVVGCQELDSCGGAGMGGTGMGGTGVAGATTSGGSSSSAALVHRYSFETTGTTEVTDSIGHKNGTLVGASYGVDDQAGSAVLAGAPLDQYVDLPNHLLSGLRDATFESWVTWNGGEAWQRVFDFGEDTTGVDDSRVTPRSYLFMAFRPQPRAAFQKPGAASEIIVEAGFGMPTNVLTHLALVVDETNQRLSLYVNGVKASSTKFNASLTDIYDVNDWLGRSLFRGDPNLGGTISEFRIYDRALSAAELLQSYGKGSDELP